ncbi:arylesterase [Marinobacterium nitratireducens]|uniref:Arylesterase n=1 Tax=Marinobacterium nitratireducens TaxID=518897 RepID=A0A918DY23_9GAMM|nr:arylesterase [Marinobacterium nitratireducens]GGO87825.1 arylesterase [Marinobacterium nitratireducens]
MFRLVCMLFLLLTPAIGSAQSVLVLGDSLSAAYGMPASQGWVALLQQRLDQSLPGTEVVNASISGETTQGGLTRLPDLLERHRPALVLVELGANDGLRGTPLPAIRQNLEQLISRSQSTGAQVLMIGMHLPPNYGPRYSQGFYALFAEVSESYGVPRVPFLLEGVALEPELMQDDGLHPNAAAQPRLLENVWPHLEPLLPVPEAATGVTQAD